MIRPYTRIDNSAIDVWISTGSTIRARYPSIREYLKRTTGQSLSRDPAWLDVFATSFGHRAYALEAQSHGQTCGFLPLVLVESMLFGRFLVSLPYLNSNGVIGEAADIRTHLVNRAIELADELSVRHLELRQEQVIDHPRLNGLMQTKVHMRLDLPATPESQWSGYTAKVRNQIRKGERSDLTVRWGREDALEAFYQVICHNMRDLGTPV